MISYKCLKGYSQGRSKDLISVRQESLLKIEPGGKNYWRTYVPSGT